MGTGSPSSPPPTISPLSPRRSQEEDGGVHAPIRQHFIGSERLSFALCCEAPILGRHAFLVFLVVTTMLGDDF